MHHAATLPIPAAPPEPGRFVDDGDDPRTTPTEAFAAPVPAVAEARGGPLPSVRLDVGEGGRGYVLRPGERLLVGADRSCDLVVRDPGVSPRHCGLYHRGNDVELWDCSGTAAIHFAGARVVRALLPLNGSFEIGQARVRMRVLRGEQELLAGMVGRSKAMHELAEVIRRVGPLDVPVLLRGESGSGKELAARAIHATSRRSAAPFVAVNGAGLSEALAASALFGHVRGAFTGAQEARGGAFRQADGGTLFIDEVAAIPLATQALLLRTLEDFQVKPVGSDTPHRVDVRIVTATCEELELAARRGRFRLDLYQRIATCVVRVPPLRERADDIELLAVRALEEVVPGARLAPDALDVVRDYPFPGNVRELKNVLLQAAVRSADGVVRACDLEAVIRYRNGEKPPQRAAAMTDAELCELLAACGGNVTRAAQRAGLPRSTFRDRVRRGLMRGGEDEPAFVRKYRRGSRLGCQA